jgi:nucleotide-binding universal stress UspA family protein
VGTILIGVDASERSEDAIAFGRQLASATEAHVIIANAFPYSDAPSRASSAPYRNALREDAMSTVHRMRDLLEGVPEDRMIVRVAADPSPAKLLHDLAHSEGAALVVVGSTHTGTVGRVLPGSTGERLLHGAPCSVAIVPKDYRLRDAAPIARIGVAYNSTPEAKAAATAAAALARALGAQLEVIGVVAPESYNTPALMGAPAFPAIREELEERVQSELDAVVAELPSSITAITGRRTGEPIAELTARSAELDLLIVGSRGYGPLHAVIAGGVSGRLMRNAQCPVIVVPRGVEAPLEQLFGGGATATVA